MNRNKLNFLKAKKAYPVDDEIERELYRSLNLKDDADFGKRFFRRFAQVELFAFASSIIIVGIIIGLYIHFNY